MAELIAVVGESGTGKTRSILGLPPQSTFFITVSGKSPSFPGGRKNYTPFNMATKKGNYFHCTSYDQLVPSLINGKESRGLLKAISQDNEFSHIKHIVIDDYQYLLGFEFMERAYEKGWDKFTEIGRHAFDVIKIAGGLKNDLKVYILSHEEQISKQGVVKRKIKTIGNMLDDKITLEGLFNIVLFTFVKKEVAKETPDYFFMTQTNGDTTAKSPEGMFSTFLIENNLGIVAEAIDKYYL